MRRIALLAGFALALGGCSSANSAEADASPPDAAATPDSDPGAPDGSAIDGAPPACPDPHELRETLCDGIDNDCNGVIDDVAVPPPWFRDVDGDGRGAGTAARFGCAQPTGFVASADDCDDTDPTVHPGASDVCDGLDNDCNASTNETCGHGCQVKARPDDRKIYLFCTEAQGWNQARALCVAEGFDLAVIDDLPENTWIRTTANPINNESWWIGSTDQAEEGKWTWLGTTHFWQGARTGAAVDGRFVTWSSNEPNNDGEEDCGEIVRAGDGGWNDNKCAHGEKFICERTLPPRP